MHKTKPRLQRGVALALIDNIENLGKTIASQLTPLPVVTPDLTDDLPEAEVLEYEEPEPAEEDEVDLPPELQPQPMDDGITWHDPEHAIHDDFEETPEILAALKECADYDPNIYPEMVKECGASVLKQTLDEYDAVDMKNCGNWSRREDPEAPFFTRDDYAWLKADIQECSQGAVPKLYKRLDVPSNIIRDVIVSEDYTDLPLSCEYISLTTTSGLSTANVEQHPRLLLPTSFSTMSPNHAPVDTSAMIGSSARYSSVWHI